MFLLAVDLESPDSARRGSAWRAHSLTTWTILTDWVRPDYCTRGHAAGRDLWSEVTELGAEDAGLKPGTTLNLAEVDEVRAAIA